MKSLHGMVYPPVTGLVRIDSEASLLAPDFSLFLRGGEGGRGQCH